MGETDSLLDFVHRKAALIGAVLLLLCSLLFVTKTYAMSADESALMQRLPDSTMVTALEARTRINHWKAFLKNTQNKSVTEKLTDVNNYFNALRFVEDADLWKRADYWATPLQLLAAGAGDCEDLVIAKYITLKNLGIPNENLRITYVWYHDAQSSKRKAHMVLTYNASAKASPLVLDILTNDIQTLTQRVGMEPVYGLNSEGLWLVGDNAQLIYAGSPAQLPQWRQLSQAMENDKPLLQVQL